MLHCDYSDPVNSLKYLKQASRAHDQISSFQSIEAVYPQPDSVAWFEMDRYCKNVVPWSHLLQIVPRKFRIYMKFRGYCSSGQASC